MQRDIQHERRPHILLIYRDMIPSILLCGHAQLSYLDATEAVEYRSRQEQTLKKRDLDWADVVLLGRLDSWYESRLASALRANGKYLIYIIDDDLLNVPDAMSSSPHYRLVETKNNIRAIMSLSHAIMSPSPRLLEKYAVDGRKALLIEEPALHAGTFTPHVPGTPIVIGFAGSIDRKADVEDILRSALTKIHAEYRNKVKFIFFGAVPDFAEDLQAEVYPYCGSYEKYLQMLDEQHWDIGLAPMPEKQFHSYKHYIKFIEYASLGIAGFFSATEPYTRLMGCDAPAIFCTNSTDAWYYAIKELLDHADRLEQMRQDAFEYARAQFSCEKTSAILLPMLLDAAANKASTECKGKKSYCLTLNKLLNIIHLTVLFIKKHKWNTLKMLVRKIVGKLT